MPHYKQDMIKSLRADAERLQGLAHYEHDVEALQALNAQLSARIAELEASEQSEFADDSAEALALHALSGEVYHKTAYPEALSRLFQLSQDIKLYTHLLPQQAQDSFEARISELQGKIKAFPVDVARSNEGYAAFSDVLSTLEDDMFVFIFKAYYTATYASEWVKNCNSAMKLAIAAEAVDGGKKLTRQDIYDHAIANRESRTQRVLNKMGVSPRRKLEIDTGRINAIISSSMQTLAQYKIAEDFAGAMVEQAIAHAVEQTEAGTLQRGRVFESSRASAFLEQQPRLEYARISQLRRQSSGNPDGHEVSRHLLPAYQLESRRFPKLNPTTLQQQLESNGVGSSRGEIARPDTPRPAAARKSLT